MKKLKKHAYSIINVAVVVYTVALSIWQQIYWWCNPTLTKMEIFQEFIYWNVSAIAATLILVLILITDKGKE